MEKVSDKHCSISCFLNFSSNGKLFVRRLNRIKTGLSQSLWLSGSGPNLCVSTHASDPTWCSGYFAAQYRHHPTVLAVVSNPATMKRPTYGHNCATVSFLPVAHNSRQIAQLFSKQLVWWEIHDSPTICTCWLERTTVHASYKPHICKLVEVGLLPKFRKLPSLSAHQQCGSRWSLTEQESSCLHA